MGATIIRAIAHSTLTAILTTPTGQLNYEITITDVQIDGNSGAGATVSNGIYGFGTSDSIFQRIRVVNVSGNAIQLDGFATYLGTANKVLNSFIRNCRLGFLNTSNSTDSLVQGCDFGSCTNQAFYIAGSNSCLIGCVGWGSSVGCSVDPTAALIWINGCRFDNNAYNGIYDAGPNVTVSGCLILDNSQAASGTKAGIEVASGAGNILITGTRSLGGSIVGETQQSYGVLLDAGRTGPAIITGCDFSNNGSGSISVSQVTGDRISNVNGYSPAGPQTSPLVPASLAALVNPFLFDCTVYLGGGSVSNAFLGGTYIPSSYGLGGLRVPAGASITIEYSTSPTWTWIGD